MPGIANKEGTALFQVTGLKIEVRLGLIYLLSCLRTSFQSCLTSLLYLSMPGNPGNIGILGTPRLIVLRILLRQVNFLRYAWSRDVDLNFPQAKININFSFHVSSFSVGSLSNRICIKTCSNWGVCLYFPNSKIKCKFVPCQSIYVKDSSLKSFWT